MTEISHRGQASPPTTARLNLTPAEVVREHPELRTSARTLQRWCREGKVHHHRTPSDRILFTPEDVAKLLERHAPRERHPEVLTPNPVRVDPMSVRAVVPITRARRGA